MNIPLNFPVPNDVPVALLGSQKTELSPRMLESVAPWLADLKQQIALRQAMA